MYKYLIFMFVVTATFLLSGCHEEVADATTLIYPERQNNADERQDNMAQTRITIDKTVESPKEIKIATVMPDAFNSETWVIYLRPDTVEFETKNPPQFRCKVRIVSIEDDAVPEVELKPRLNTYEFFVHEGDVYYRSVNHMGWKNSGKVKGSAFAVRIYNYVVKHM